MNVRAAPALVLLPLALAMGCDRPGVTPEQARAIAEEAYIYGFPMVDSYRIQHAYFVDSTSPEYKAPWNHLVNIPRVYTPADKAVQTPNSDTPYSWLGLDLRTEPVVLTVPPIEKGRYFSIQFVDAYTFDFAYLGSRTSGNGGGTYMIAGPAWKGETPAGVDSVIHAETDFVMAVYRTQLFDAADLGNVIRIQDGYQAQPLSAFLGQPAPAAAPPIDFRTPLTAPAERDSVRFFEILDFLLQYCPVDSTETAVRERFASVGIGGARRFDAGGLTPEVRTAFEQGMRDAWARMDSLRHRVDAKEVTSGELFGTRAFLRNNYLYRMAGAVLGIYGNSKLEAMYPVYGVDAAGQPLVGTNRYILHFGPNQLPPVHAFWSLTMYEMPASLLVANPIDRYLINSPMLPSLTRDADSGLTLYVQHQSPGRARESNWLPAPAGPFAMVMRLYWPQESALDGTWTAPPLTVVR